MLVLSRKINDRVVIEMQNPDGSVMVDAEGNLMRGVLLVVDTRGESVRLGFEGPPSMRFDREEIFRERTGESLPPLKDPDRSPVRHKARTPRW